MRALYGRGKLAVNDAFRPLSRAPVWGVRVGLLPGVWRSRGRSGAGERFASGAAGSFCVVTERGVRESWGVRRLVVMVALVVSGWTLAGCTLAEYVLPGGSRGDTESSGDATVASGDVPTGGTVGDSDGECEVGLTRCGDECVDLQRAEAHCGGCEEPCKSDEMCVVGECRDVVVLDCESCPCTDQCPGGGQGGGDGGEGSEGSEGSDGETGGSDPQQRLCCELEAKMQVVCIVGDVGDALVCPG